MSEQAEQLLKKLYERMLFRGPLADEGWALEQIDMALSRHAAELERTLERLTKAADDWVNFDDRPGKFMYAEWRDRLKELLVAINDAKSVTYKEAD